MPEKLTVLIPCKNEERNIRPCIASAKGIADEVLVADSGSADRTMDVAREMDARIIEREYVNSANFKNWAIPQAKHPWVLVVDADERVTPELAGEIRKVLAQNRRPQQPPEGQNRRPQQPPEGQNRHPQRPSEDNQPRPLETRLSIDGYRIRRRGYFFGHPIRHSGWQSDSVLRLFRRDGSRYQDKHVHADVIIESGNVGRLEGRLEHYTYWTFDQYFEKFGRYTTWAAQDLRDRGRRAGVFSLTFRPAFSFFKSYVLKLGFLDGLPGLLISMLGAFSVFTKYAKLWRMQHGLPQPDPEGEAAENGKETTEARRHGGEAT